MDDDVRPNAGHLVTSWCSGYKETHASAPHPALVKRVAGVSKTVARYCSEIEHWRSAWRAAHAAGRAGIWDYLPLTADEHADSGTAAGGHLAEAGAGSEQRCP